MAAVAEALLLLARTFENQGAVLEVTLKRILLDFKSTSNPEKIPTDEAFETTLRTSEHAGHQMSHSFVLWREATACHRG